MDLNKVMLIGRVTQDPEIRTTSGGQSVVNFSVATNRVWKDQQGQQQSQVEYHNIVAWAKLADVIAQYAPKGKQLYIEGRLQTRNWEGKDGVKRYTTEVVARNIILLGGPGGGGQRQTATARVPAASEKEPSPSPAPSPKAAKPGPAKKSPGADAEEEINIEDIPF